MSDYDDYDDDFESDVGSPLKAQRSAHLKSPTSVPASSVRSSAAPSEQPSARSATAVAAPAPASRNSNPPPGAPPPRGPPPRAPAGKVVRASAPGVPPSPRDPPPPAAGRRRAASSASSRPNATPVGGRRSSSTAGGRRNMTPPAMLQKLAAETEDTPELRELEELRKANLALRAELLHLNRKLDEQLGQRGQRAGRAPPVARGAARLPSDKLIAKNDAQRKANDELREQLNRPHIRHRMSEVKNMLGHLKTQLDEAMSENQGLMNVIHNQEQQLARVRLVEEEMDAAKRDHAEAVRQLKEQAKLFKDAREQDMAVYTKQIRQVERMEEKLKVQDEVGAAVKSVETVKEQVEEKDRMIDALKYQVAVLSRTNHGDKKRTKAVNDRLARELHSLREEAESLRKQLKATGLAGELGVDVRI